MMGWTLTEARLFAGLTQAQVAERFGTNQSGISRMERQHDWLVSTLVDYAAAIGGTVVVVITLADGQHCELLLPPPIREAVES